MFQNKNMLTASDNGENQTANEFITHTMKKDLAEINNPDLIENIHENNYIPPINLTPQQKSSPFLNTTPAKITAPEGPTASEFHFSGKKYSPSESKNNPINIEENPLFSKSLTITLVAMIILSIIGGIFFFWSTRQVNPIIVEEPPQGDTAKDKIVEPIIEPIIEPEPTAPQYSTTKPNYLNIDILNADINSIKETLNSTAANILAAELSTPVEFIVSDSQNNPIPISIFATKFKLDFSHAVLSNFADTFSVFFYNDQGKTHLALAIDAKNESALRSALKKDEGLLYTQLASLFPMVSYSLPTGPFTDSTYKNAMIRYKNIISPSELSIDYTVFNKKLLIGTTMMTLRSVIDYFIANTLDSVD